MVTLSDNAHWVLTLCWQAMTAMSVAEKHKVLCLNELPYSLSSPPPVIQVISLYASWDWFLHPTVFFYASTYVVLKRETMNQENICHLLYSLSKTKRKCLDYLYYPNTFFFWVNSMFTNKLVPRPIKKISCVSFKDILQWLKLRFKDVGVLQCNCLYFLKQQSLLKKFLVFSNL